jgi:hypothetical protein
MQGLGMPLRHKLRDQASPQQVGNVTDAAVLEQMSERRRSRVQVKSLCWNARGSTRFDHHGPLS